MAVPKRKTSKARRDKRRSHLSIKLPAQHTCPQCKQTTRPHAVCNHCGHYKGKEVVSVDV